MPLHTVHPSPPSSSTDHLLARLTASAARLDTELHTLPTLPRGELPAGQALASDLEQALKTWWNAPGAPGLPRYKALARALEQDLHDEAALKISDASLPADARHCLPRSSREQAGERVDEPVDEPVDVQTLYLARDDQPGQEIHGALVFSRPGGGALLYLPGRGLEGFTGLPALRETLARWLDDPVQASALLCNTALDYQQAIAQVQADPDLQWGPFSARDVLLPALAGNPFEHAIKRQVARQRQDVAWACRRQSLRESDLPAWTLGIQAALDLRERLGPAAMLRLRRGPALQEPQWLRHLESAERKRYLDSLAAYEQARLALARLMQGCASIQQFASTRLAACLQDELGYDLDPQRVIVSTERHTPIGQQRYQSRHSMALLALHGLHENDLEPGSDFQTRTHLTLDGLPLNDAYPLLTPAWLAGVIAGQALRVRFAQAQRKVHDRAEVRNMMAQVIRRQMIAQAHAALYQGHFLASDFACIDALLEPPGARRVQFQQVRLNGQVMADMLLLRLQAPDGSLDRLILFTRHAPRDQQFQGFDNERQLLHELVGWSASGPLTGYLLGQLDARQRPALQSLLQALSEKAQPPANLLDFVDCANATEALQAMVREHIQINSDQQQHYTPAWYLHATPAQRRELQGLDDAIAHLLENWQSQAQLPDYERFVHHMASDRINALLGLAEGTVDPDRIIIHSPRETLSYTRMLRDGYDDSIGFLNAGADTQATFSGPPGIDLSPLTPEKVAGSVRGAWPSDAWVAHVKGSLLDPQRDGYPAQRRMSLLITQLQMRSAALRGLLKGQIAVGHYNWLKHAIDRMHHSDPLSRRRYPVYPLQLRLDNPFIASGVPALGDVLSVAQDLLPTGIPVSRLETVQGCYILCPEGADGQAQALIYTPGAPDGVEFRALSRFIETLHHTGMSDYYKDRCRLAMNRTLAFYFIDLKQRSDSQPPALPDTPYADLQEICFDRVILRRLRDVEDASTGRAQMITRLVLNSLELVAVAVTLPFPPASFAVGAVLAVRDSALALQALSEGDQEAASLYVLGSWLNTLGAAGDASSGLRGLGGLLRRLADRGGHNPALAAARHVQASPAAAFKPLEADDLLRPLADDVPPHVPPRAGERQPNPAYAVQRDLAHGTPMSTSHGQGVTLLDGHPCIALEGQVYQVQYDARLRLWQIIDPANPFAFFGKQPVWRTDSGQWRLLDPLRLRGGGGDVKFGALPRPSVNDAVAGTPATRPYELPAEFRQKIPGIADLNWKPIEEYGLDLPADFYAPHFAEGRQVYAGLREQLRLDAQAFFEQVSLPARPEVPLADSSLTPDGLIKAVFERSRGMVVSETPASVASKQFLIEHMARLAEQDVGILYIEHLFTDAHLQKLQKYMTLGNRTSAGSRELKNHLNTLNEGLLVNASRHDHYHLIKAAHRHGIQVRPLSSSVSYDFIHSSAPVVSDDPAAMQKMSVFFGHLVISADTAEAPARRWVALLDHTRASRHQQVPGIAELHGAISIRVEDVAADQPVRILRERPLLEVETGTGTGDLRLEMPNPHKRPTPRSPTQAANPPAPQPGSSGAASLSGNPGGHGWQLDSHGHWQAADAAAWPAHREPTTLQRSLADPRYQMPEQHHTALHRLTFFEHRGLNILYNIDDEALEPARTLFFKQRARLQDDARTLASQPLPDRPVLPDIDPQASPAEVFDTLYAHTRAVVIGESHGSVASKQVIIDNLPHLSRQQVKTLYVEHLQTDLHQADLDLFFEKGLMSDRLLHFLRHLDRNLFTDPSGVHTFEQLVIKAREHGIEVRALDCMASYYLRNMLNPGTTTRQQMMNFFASRTIRRHQQLMGPHKWLALVGEAHASTFNRTVPGLAELEQGISLRIFDTPPGESFGPAVDPGRVASDELGLRQAFVRNDYAMGLPVPRRPATLDALVAGGYHPLPTPVPLEVRLHSPGLFIVEGAESGQPVILHRSRNQQIERTPVLSNRQGKLYIDREGWKALHLRPFNTLSALLQALREMNLTLVS